MNRDSVRDQLIGAVESEGGFAALRALVKELVDAGESAEAFRDDLENVRKLVDDEREELVLDVMDHLVGWSAPSQRLVDPKPYTVPVQRPLGGP